MPSVSWNIKAWIWEWLGISDKFEFNWKRTQQQFEENHQRQTRALNEYISTMMGATQGQLRDQFATAALGTGKTPKEAYDLAEQMLDERDIRNRKRSN